MRAKGNSYENLAWQYLKKRNFELLERNYQTRFGEIDIIAKSDQTIVFVEVRYRKDANYGSPEDTITLRKQQKIIKSAQIFLNEFAAWEYDCRFDVITFSGNRSLLQRPTANWIQAAFTPQEL